MRFFRLLLPLLLLASVVHAETAFDPAQHMRVSEVKPGMKGYGLSVFKGTKIERFDVEVISVLHNFNPKYDVILIRASGQNLEHAGAVAGMSGSPIYLKDEKGRERMCGAFAYGFPLAKDPVAGVQPIEYMLQLTEPKPGTTITGSPKDDHPDPARAGAQRRATWSLRDAILLPGMSTPPLRFPLARRDSL